MAQERIQKSKTTTETKTKVVEDVEASVDSEAQKLKDETDALLDEIDAELADNDAMVDFWADIDEALGDRIGYAQEYIAAYQQKGGE